MPGADGSREPAPRLFGRGARLHGSTPRLVAEGWGGSNIFGGGGSWSLSSPRARHIGSAHGSDLSAAVRAVAQDGRARVVAVGGDRCIRELRLGEALAVCTHGASPRCQRQAAPGCGTGRRQGRPVVLVRCPQRSGATITRASQRADSGPVCSCGATSEQVGSYCTDPWPRSAREARTRCSVPSAATATVAT